MSINAAKQQMSFLASVLESYEGLVSGKIGNSELTKEDYDQIDPVEMELIDIHWCLASGIRRAQRYMEITGKQSIGGPSIMLGFDKSKVTCFRCKQKGHFKRECKNSEVDETEKPFNDDYYRKAIYHRSKEEPKMIKNNPKEKSRACAVIHDDGGFDWSEILPEEDRIDNRFTAHGRTISKSKHHVFVAEIKEKTREEILSEKTDREIFIVGCRMEKMQEEYENAVRNKRWDKNPECYVNRDGEPVVPRKDIVHDDVLQVIPLSGEFYSKREKDKNYEKKLDKIIRDAMTSSLRKRDEVRMKKNVECMVEELEKVAEEVKGKEEKVVKSEADQKQMEANTELNSAKNAWNHCSACTEKDEEFRKRDLEFNKIEEVFKNKCKEMLENEKVLKDNDEKITQKCTNLEKENEILKEKVLKMTDECFQKEKECQEMKKEYDSIKLAYHITKDTIKQQVVNSHIEDVAKLKRQIADLEQDNNKLHNYHASSYVLERIFNIKPCDDDSEKNKKGIGSEFHQVPPPEKFAFYDDEKVEKAFNMVDQLPDNIDVTYSKSDDSSDLEVVGKVVESVLKEESVETGKSESQDGNKGSFHEEYLKNSKSEKNLNDDSKRLVYTMIGSDKLFLDVVFPIQNVISEKIDKVFKMVEIEKSEIPKFAGKCHKTFYNKPGYKKKNMKAGLGYKKKQNWKKNEMPNYQTKMNFVLGTSSEEEKELQFRRQSNEEFYAQKKRQQPQVKDVSKRTCFKCDQIGHLAHKCPNLKPVGVETKKKSVYVQKQKSDVVTQKSTKFDSKQTWKPKMSKVDSQQTWKLVTSRFRTTQSWKTTVDATKPNQFWKPKVVVQNQNVQKESHFYKNEVLLKVKHGLLRNK
ncbi:putative transcription factor interactor and regulator CCHC(Zn) family [Helianthus annuus]|nr:putative transcription factor interactor and regulator CCHC(Zn) family [Helianthus annuus]